VGSFRISARADEELVQIYEFGHVIFGPHQAVKYQLELDHVFGLLADNPRMGRLAPKIGPRLRRHEHASHVILYVEEADGILVAAVVYKGSLRGLHI
jgi:toxin ParE1/3/4